MFEPKTYWEKRAALSESLIQHLLGIVGSHEPQLQAQIQDQWFRSNDHLKTYEANLILGDAPEIAKEELATLDWIYETAQQNFGATFFAGHNVFENPEGAIGDDIHQLMDWINSLPDLANEVNPSIQPGFFAEVTHDGRRGLALMFVKNGFLYAASFGGYIHLQQLSLENLPTEWTWRNGFYRSEFFNYRNDLTRVEFLGVLSEALKSVTAFSYTNVYADNLTDAAREAAATVVDQNGLTLVVEPLRVIQAPAANDEGPLPDLGLGDAVAAMESAMAAEGVSVPSIERATDSEDNFANDVVVHDSAATPNQPA